VHQAAWLGQHALSYTVLSFLAITIHRRLLWFDAAAYRRDCESGAWAADAEAAGDSGGDAP